jgi:hypothetical protein
VPGPVATDEAGRKVNRADGHRVYERDNGCHVAEAAGCEQILTEHETGRLPSLPGHCVPCCLCCGKDAMASALDERQFMGDRRGPRGHPTIAAAVAVRSR